MADSLREQMLKLGLVNEKQARQAKHDKRVKNHDRGARGVEAEREAKRRQADEARRAQQQADRDREQARQREESTREGRFRVAQIVESGAWEGPVHGNNRFYYEARDGRIPYLDLSHEANNAVQNGQAAIAEAPNGKATVITADAATRVADIDRTWLRAWRGRG